MSAITTKLNMNHNIEGGQRVDNSLLLA